MRTVKSFGRFFVCVCACMCVLFLKLIWVGGGRDLCLNHCKFVMLVLETRSDWLRQTEHCSLYRYSANVTQVYS